MFPNIDSSSRGSKKQNPSGINLVPEFITISIKTDYDSYLLIKHVITPVNQQILKNVVTLALMQVYDLPTKGGARFHEYLVQCTHIPSPLAGDNNELHNRTSSLERTAAKATGDLNAFYCY